MVTKEQLAVGSRVTLGEYGGVVEHITDEHVRIRWDDGCIGVLYFSSGVVIGYYATTAHRRSFIELLLSEVITEGKADQDA